MARPDKAAAIDVLKESFTSADAAVLTEYRGRTGSDQKDLRRSLGENATYAVTKNTLTLIAAKQADKRALGRGPMTAETIRLSEELHKQLNFLGKLKAMAPLYG